jgi:iron complex outermembrane receptor protein
MLLIGAALLSVLAAAAPVASASQSPTATAAPLAYGESIDVTAKGLTEEIAGVPAVVTVVGGDELRARGATDLREALAAVAGVDVAPGGDNGPAASVPEFWGLKEFDAFLLVVDGVPSGGAFNPALTTLDLADVDRIEVLRGPAPVMYGATSFVGVLHVVRRAPSDRTREVQATFGSYGSRSLAGDLGLPQWGGFDSRLAVDATRAGYRDDRTGFDRFHGLWRGSRALGAGRLGIDIEAEVVNQDPASPLPREGASLSTRVPQDANHNPDGAFLDDKRFTGTVRYDRPLGDAQWGSTLSFDHATTDIFRGFLEDIDAPVDNAHGIRGKVELTDVYFDSHVAWSRSERVKIVLGIDHLHGEGEAKGGDFDYTVDLPGLVPATGLLIPVLDDDQVEDRRELSGAYGFVEWSPSRALKLEGGLRLNRTTEEREDPREERTKPAGGEQEDGEREQTRLSGTVGVSWAAWQRGAESLHLFADYRSAFKPAAFDFGIGEGEGGGEEGLLEPETADTYEAGVRARLAGGRVGVTVSGFWMDFRNLVIATSVNGVPALANSGKNRFQGVEAEAEWIPRDHLIVRGGYAYHDATFRDSIQVFDGVPTQLAGNRLELSAHHVAGASAAWSPDRGLQASADLHYVGSRFLNKRNTALADAYIELGARWGWRMGRWEVGVTGRNLTNERSPVSESELGDSQYYILPARTVEAAARVRF